MIANRNQEHCLNHLRKSAMCHGDVGMVTYRWGNDSRKPYAAATAHQCVDFEALTTWTNERTVDMFKPGLLIHPTLGTSLLPQYIYHQTITDCPSQVPCIVRERPKVSWISTFIGLEHYLLQPSAFLLSKIMVCTFSAFDRNQTYTLFQPTLLS